MTDWLLAASVFSKALYILYVALGLSLVIFFHELGHFAVAKWCDVNVERFSIGFGPILLAFRRGETEYALSAIPFGGYVKMLGQDDIDPSQLTSEEIAQDPRSYSAKSVPQRMAIISAGVIMNVITGLLFFAFAFNMGIQRPPSVIGSIRPGSPAWVAGLENGYRITHLNGEPIGEFSEIMLGVALSAGDVELRGVDREDQPFEMTITPDGSGTRRILGIEAPRGLRVMRPRDERAEPTIPTSAAGTADPPFQPGDLIVEIGGEPIHSFPQLQQVLAKRRGDPLDFVVERVKSKERVTIPVGTNHFRSLGLIMDIGPITHIERGSPAAVAGLQVNDKITRVNGKEVGKELDPLRLPDVLADNSSSQVTVEVLRQEPNGGPVNHEIRIVPRDRPGWLERPTGVGVPLSVPAIGICYSVIPHVLEVSPDSPAAAQGIEADQSIKKVELVPGEVFDGVEEVIAIEFKEPHHNWAFAFWMIQTYPTRSVRLTVGSDESVVEIPADEISEVADWFLPTRGIGLQELLEERKAENLWAATQMGIDHTKATIVQIYLTLRSLVRGDVSPKELHGPVGIATVAYEVARQGIAKLLLFLGFLSINLAVLNFLPIPVLDGGHMVFLIWEGVTRRRPSEKVMVAATYVGMIFVLSLMAFVLYLDIFVHMLGGG